MAQRTGYSALQIGLHWLIAALIAAAYFLGEGMERALRTRIETGQSGMDGNTLHVWLGGAVFALVLIRILVRLVQGAPAPVPGSSELVEKLGMWAHRLLYVLMLAVPVLGASAWYLGIRALGEPHAVLGNALVVVALGHALVALTHHYVLKDATLTRMLRPGR